MKNYKIDFAANTVTVTKTFLRTAQTDINSAEFKTLTQLREMGLDRYLTSLLHRENEVKKTRLAVAQTRQTTLFS